jgi:hypothetical protein
VALLGCGGDERDTAPAAAVVWAVGDGADGGAAAKEVAARIVQDRPDRLLYLGDVYETGTAEEFRTHYHSVYGELKDRTKPTPGNHEWPLHAQGYDPYWGVPPWYVSRVGGWRLISLNSEADHDDDSPQLRWLRSEAPRAGGTCTIAFWHRPFLNAGRYGDQVDVAPFVDALRGHAAIVLTGHDHDMQRFRPQDGIVHYVSGAGGHDRYEVDADDPRLAFSDDQHYGALRLELRPGRADLAFVASDGAVLDRSSVTCRR